MWDSTSESGWSTTDSSSGWSTTDSSSGKSVADSSSSGISATDSSSTGFTVPSSGKTVTDKLSVLLADSDAKMVEIHQTLLEDKFDMDVTTAVTRKELFSAYRQGYDILFVALNLPALDGIELTKILRRMKQHGKIVGLYDDKFEEGYDEDDVDLFVKAGLDACIKKPLTEDKVRLILSNTKSE